MTTPPPAARRRVQPARSPAAAAVRRGRSTPLRDPDVKRAVRPRSSHFFSRLLGLALLAVLGWSLWVTHQINVVAGTDHAEPADAIAVFGAAEYAGHPSPVLHARLDKVVSLYNRGIAPLVITLGGGADKDSGNTEGGVGRDYLLANGVPYSRIIAETSSVDTEQQVDRLATIAREHNLRRLVVVSDSTHLFRIQRLCEDAGLVVYTSPRPSLGNIGGYDLFMRYVHEIASYTALRLNLHVSWLHRWFEGKAD